MLLAYRNILSLSLPNSAEDIVDLMLDICFSPAATYKTDDFRICYMEIGKISDTFSEQGHRFVDRQGIFHAETSCG